MKLFNKWGSEGIEIQDPGLKNYINLSPILVPHSHGRHSRQIFNKSKIHIIERFMNHLTRL